MTQAASQLNCPMHTAGVDTACGQSSRLQGCGPLRTVRRRRERATCIGGSAVALSHLPVGGRCRLPYMSGGTQIREARGCNRGLRPMWGVTYRSAVSLSRAPRPPAAVDERCSSRWGRPDGVLPRGLITGDYERLRPTTIPGSATPPAPAPPRQRSCNENAAPVPKGSQRNNPHHQRQPGRARRDHEVPPQVRLGSMTPACNAPPDALCARPSTEVCNVEA